MSVGRLDGKVALITGAARGQGEAHARRLTAEGAAVLLADVLDADGERIAEELRGHGRDAMYATLDVASSTAWESGLELVRSRWGRLDILVNNAGIVRVSPLTQESEADWNRVMAVQRDRGVSSACGPPPR